MQAVYVGGFSREQRQRTGAMRQGRRENCHKMSDEDHCCGQGELDSTGSNRDSKLSTGGPGTGVITKGPLAPVGGGLPLGTVTSGLRYCHPQWNQARWSPVVLEKFWAESEKMGDVLLK